MRRRRKDTGDALTLFPFLAVLICTMGSLIVLLVILVQQAKANAKDVTRRKSETDAAKQMQVDEASERIKRQIEEAAWRIEALEESHATTVEQLDRRRDELAYLEDEIRQLHDRLDRTAAEAEQIQDLKDDQQQDHQSTREDLQQLRERLQYAEEKLVHARRAAENRKTSYAIVPYDGENGTRRRPIYVECRSDRIILQPEGVELVSSDFREPLTDDNALAAALRAQREYLKDAAATTNDPPYPLLIVRPDGAQAYAAARAAMKSWDTEFGYELVGADLELAYPEPSDSLVRVTRQAVEEARARRKLLQQIAPARFGRHPSGSSSQQFVAAAPTSGSTTDGDPDAARSSAGPRAGVDRTASQSARSGPADVGDGVPPGGPSAVTSGKGALRYNDTVADGLAQPGPGNGANSTPAGQSTSGGPTLANSQARSASTDQSAASAANSAVADRAEGDPSTRRRLANQGEATQGRSAAKPGAMQGSSGGSAAGSDNSMTSVGAPALTQQSLAADRGRNWALPDRAAGSTGITRPIYVACYADRLVLLSEERHDAEQLVLSLDQGVPARIDQLVEEVAKRIESWGIAGVNMYWKPVLQVDVAKGAENRYAVLAALLRESGIVVLQK